MAGEAGYPWTVMQKTRSQDEGGSNAPGPWIVAWRWSSVSPFLVLSPRLLADVSRADLPTADLARPMVFYMDAQQEPPFLFKQWNSAIRVKDDVLKRIAKDPRWSPGFEIKVLTLEELDRWKIESELRRIASESEPGESG